MKFYLLTLAGAIERLSEEFATYWQNNKKTKRKKNELLLKYDNKVLCSYSL